MLEILASVLDFIGVQLLLLLARGNRIQVNRILDPVRISKLATSSESKSQSERVHLITDSRIYRFNYTSDIEEA